MNLHIKLYQLLFSTDLDIHTIEQYYAKWAFCPERRIYCCIRTQLGCISLKYRCLHYNLKYVLHRSNQIYFPEFHNM